MEPVFLLILPQVQDPVGYAAAGILGLTVCVTLLVQILRCGRR